MHEVVASPLQIHLPLFLSVSMSAQARADNNIMNTKRLGVMKMNNNTNRKRELDSFVCREVYACQTALIEEALKQQIFSVDDIYNLYREFDGQLLSPN